MTLSPPVDETNDIERDTALKKARAGDENDVIVIPTKTAAQDRRVLVVAPDDSPSLVETAVQDRGNVGARKRLHAQNESQSTALSTETRHGTTTTTSASAGQDGEDDVIELTEGASREFQNTIEYCKLTALMDDGDGEGDSMDVDPQQQHAPQACEAPVLPPVPESDRGEGPAAAAGRRKRKAPQKFQPELPKPKTKPVKGKGKRAVGRPKKVLRRPGAQAGLIPDVNPAPADQPTSSDEEEGDDGDDDVVEVAGPSKPAEKAKRVRIRPKKEGPHKKMGRPKVNNPPPPGPPVSAATNTAMRTQYFGPTTPDVDAEGEDVEVDTTKTPVADMSLFLDQEPDGSFDAAVDTPSTFLDLDDDTTITATVSNANAMQTYLPEDASSFWNDNPVAMDIDAVPQSWFEPIANRLRPRPGPEDADVPVPSIEDADDYQTETQTPIAHRPATLNLFENFNVEAEARYGPDHEEPTIDFSFKPLPKCTYCDETYPDAPCDLRPGRYTLECTNCTNKRAEDPFHRCKLIEDEHKLLYRRYNAKDPMVFVREDVCGGCAGTAKAMTCDMDPVLSIGCTDCLARGVDCHRAKTRDKMRRRPAKPTHAQGTWFRRICDMCAANNDETAVFNINGDERPRCSWLDDRGHWKHGCLPCREKNMACTFRGFTVEPVEQMMRPTSWNPASGVRQTWLLVSKSTNFRKECVRCNQDHAPCYVGMQRPTAACKRCTAFGLSCSDKDNKSYPIFDLSLVGFGADVEMAFEACKCCLDNNRPCDRQRPCDSCVLADGGRNCDKPPKARYIKAGDYRKANLIRTRLNPHFGPLYYLALGYGDGGVGSVKTGASLMDWIGPASAVYATSMGPDQAHPLALRCTVYPPGVPPHICFGGALPALVAGSLDRESLIIALKTNWPGISLPRDTEWKKQHDLLEVARKQFGEWAKTFADKNGVYLAGLSEDFGQNTVAGTAHIDRSHPFNSMYKAWKAERMRQVMHDGQLDNNNEQVLEFTWDEFLAEEPEVMLFSGYENLPQLPDFFRGVEHNLPEYFSMAARWPLIDRHGMARIGSIVEKRKYSWRFFSNHGPWVPFVRKADGTRRQRCPAQDVLDHLPLRDNEYKLGMECDTRRCSMEGCHRLIIEDQRCASNRHKALVCDDCNAKGKRYLLDGGPRAFTTRDLLNMRAYLCGSCAEATGDDPAILGTMRTMGVNTVFGQFNNKPTSNCRARMPDGFRLSFRSSVMPASGCACAAKLFRHRVCPDHRSRDASVLHVKVRVMRTWLIDNFGGIPCPVCAATKQEGETIELTSELSGRGAPKRSWVCLSCTGWVINAPSEQKIPPGYENWISNFVPYNPDDLNEVTMNSENSITRAVQNFEWLDVSTITAMPQELMSQPFDIDFAAFNAEMFASAAAPAPAEKPVIDISAADMSAIDASFMDTTWMDQMDQTAMTANTSAITSEAGEETRNTSYDEMDIDDNFDK